MDIVDSLIKENPPVPDEGFEAFWLASRRNTPIAKMTNDPQASRATVARLRLRRRAQPRTPKSASVKCPELALRCRELNQAAAKANPATSSRAPALKKTSAFEVSPLAPAQDRKSVG